MAEKDKNGQPLPTTQMLPTPEVGLPLRYYLDDSNTEDFVAATCTKIEAPGKIGIAYMTHNRVLSYKSGVNWVGDDRRIAGSRPFKQNGCWDFLDALKPRNAMKFHQEQLAARAESQARQDAEYEAAMAARKAFQESKKKSITSDTK
jgi:hypothetical protein